MKLLADKETRKARKAACDSCQYLTNGFCGRPFTGEILQDGTRLCGCRMSIKSTLHYAACPLGKWPVSLSESDKEVIRKMLDGGNSPKEFWANYARYIGNPPNGNTSCGSCIRNAMEELRLLL